MMSTFALREACLAGGLAALICVGTSGEVTAQRITSVPDFSSNQVGWVAVGDLTPVPGKPSPIRQDPAHRYVPNNVGGQPTYRMGDLSNPNLKPWVKEWMKKDNDEVLAGKIGYTARSSCAAAGVPGFLTYPVRPVYFIQTPKQVAMIYSGDAQVRRIYLNVPHSENPKSTWYGESVGHYEGDTLVVDTIGLNTKTFVDIYRTPHTEKLHVVERFTIDPDGKHLTALVRVEDPDTFNEPLVLQQRWFKEEQAMLETVCAENNLDYFNQGLPPLPEAKKPDF